MMARKATFGGLADSASSRGEQGWLPGEIRDGHTVMAFRLAGFSTRRTATDFETAVERYQDTVDITPPDHPTRADQLQSLGTGYRDRYHRAGAVADLESAIQRYQEAVDTTPVDSPATRAGRLQRLGAGYHDRYRRFGAISDLETAIQRYQQAVDITPADDPARADHIHTVGSGFHDRYRRSGTIVDLETAIQRYQEAVGITPADDHARTYQIHAVGFGYHDRYLRVGAIADLESAIERYQEAVDITPANYFFPAGPLQGLGTGYYDRYQRLGTIADLEAAIQQLQKAIDITPADHSARASQLHNLGNGYGERYRRTGAITDLETAIERFQEAVDITPANHPTQASQLQSLGIGYGDKYRETEAIEDLEAAIQLYQRAVDRTPANHSAQAGQLYRLGIGYYDRYLKLKKIQDLETAIQRCREALDNSPSPVNDRLNSGRFLLKLHVEAKNWPHAYQTAFETVSLVPLLTPHSLETSDKQHRLTDLVGLASDAAAISLNAAKTPFDAIKVLELGRSVIAGSLNEMRADISELQQKHPQHAEEYISLRDQLDAPKTSTQFQVDQRNIAAHKFESLIQKIRTLSGFDRFLLAPSEDELKAAAEYGPIVVINVSEHRCDAFIIESSQLRALPLPRLHSNDLRDRTKDNLADPRILEWLWDTIAQPVLNALGFIQAPSLSCLPRIWWVPTGPLIRFPIHAAGYHSQNLSETVLDRVISSYSSSVKAIVLSRQTRPSGRVALKSEKVVLVSMQKTPGYKELQFAKEEVDELGSLCNSMEMQVSKPLPVQKDVLFALKDCQIFHFAGHGMTNLSDPSKSCLLLEDWDKEPLTVASLFETNLRARNPFLAYLSACGTGQVKHANLIDESLHLISACQLAGFQNVIGTLWEVNDKACVEMATMTYDWIKDHGMSGESVSEGLHRASISLRRQWISENRERGALKRQARVKNTKDGQFATEQSTSSRDKVTDPRDVLDCEDTTLNPLYWVPYVHFGA